MPVPRLPLLLRGILVAGLAVSGCVAPGGPAARQAADAGDGFNDPFEDTNRGVFAFNQAVDANVLVPAAKTYRTVVPGPVRETLHDFLQNLNGPIIFANDMLQGETTLAGQTLGRLALNTTVGFGGIFDVATQLGVPYHPNDFGITLANWGFTAGPYVIVPVLGPSNPRDLAGMAAEGFADPVNYIGGIGHNQLLAAIVAKTAVNGIDQRARNIETLAEIEKTALDYYATIRSLYRQRREAQIRHELTNLPNPGFGGDGGAPAPSMSYTVPK